MRKNPPLEQSLCKVLCSYYKPGKNEELACKGYTVVEHLIKKGKLDTLVAVQTISYCTSKDLLVRAMCTSCDFHDRDCDFIQDHTAQPCGGFILLAGLLQSAEITINDIVLNDGI